MFYQLICMGLIFHSIHHVVGISAPESKEDSKEYSMEEDSTEISMEHFNEESTEDSVNEQCTHIMDETINAMERAIECAGKMRCPRILQTMTEVDPQGIYEPMDCAEVLEGNPSLESGIYKIWFRKRFFGGSSIEVYCDMEDDGGGWTVIQRRGDYGAPDHYFWRNWTEYKNGFGDLTKDFWLGNDNIFALTNQNLNILKFELEDWEGGKKFAEYDEFRIDDEFHKYTSHVSGYRGNAGDDFSSTNKVPFSTRDKDSDHCGCNCAETYKGAWWYTACGYAHLNALYLKGQHPTLADGVNWYHFRGWYYSLKHTTIKIRPKLFKRPGLAHK